MSPEELKEHLEQVNGIDTTDDSSLGDIDWPEAHQIDHDEWLGDDAHEHECSPAHERIWHDPDVRLKQEAPDATT
jgi:hypothetical protein